MSAALGKEDKAMVVSRSLLVPVAVVAAALALASCTRKITRVEQVVQAQTCFSCHSDTSTALVAAQQQWEHSKHASGETLNENDGTCKGCHTSQGFVARATGEPVEDVIENPTSIHCFTCHAPHTNGDFRLRWTAIATLANGTHFDLKAANLCVACHQARRSVKAYVKGKVGLSNRWGPHHGVQGDMLIGSNGYEYAGYTYEITEHRTATGRGCLDCHFNTTSQNVVGGHSFNMRGEVLGDEVLNVAACHGEIDDYNVDAVQDSVDFYSAQLATQLENAGLLSGGLPAADSTSADSAGAVWNYLMATEDRSHGVHNAKYILGLLKSSILYMEGDLTPPALAGRPTQAALAAHRVGTATRVR
jgi:hypothetical protein